MNIYATHDLGTTPKPQARDPIERRMQTVRVALAGAIVPCGPTVRLLFRILAMMRDGIEVQWHTWDTAPADLWPLIHEWIRVQRAVHALFFDGNLM